MKELLQNVSGLWTKNPANLATFFIVGLFVFYAGFVQKTYAMNCTVNAGINQTICANDLLTLYGQASGLFPGGTAVVTWSQISGPSAVITSPNSLTTTVTSILGGNVYKFVISAPCQDGEIAYDTVQVTVGVTPVTDAGPDQGPKCNASPAGTLAGNALLPGETGAWTIAPGGPTGVTVVTTTSPTSAFNFTSASQSGIVKFVWTKTNTVSGCITRDTVIVLKPGGTSAVTASAIAPTACYNTTTSVTLAGSYGGNGTGGQAGLWTVVSGPNMPTITTPTSATSTVTNLIQGTYVLRWTVTGPCVNGTATATFTVPAPVGAPTTASVSVQGTPAMPICDGRTSFVLIGNSTLLSGETGLWTQTTTLPATIVSPNSPTTVVNGLDGVGPYTFRYTITNGSTGCSSGANVSISFGSPPSLTLTTVSPYMLACGLSTATINYTHTGTGTPQYSILSGPVTPTYPTIPSTYANAGGPPASLPGFTVNGTYQIRFRKVEGSGSMCNTVFEDITVIVSKNATGSNSGTDQTLACNITATQLAGNNPASGGTGTGNWSQVSGPNTAVFVNTALYNTWISGLIPGKYTFRWLISGGPACTTQQDDVTITVANAQPNQANAGPDQLSNCYGTPVTLSGSVPVLNETGTWTVVPSSGVSFSNNHSPFSVVNGLQASTTYTFTWTITNACGISSDQCVITTSNVQGPIQSAAGPDQCKTSGTTSITLAGNNPSPGTGLWTQYSGGAATITTPSAFNSTVTGMADGTYQFIWTISQGICTVSRDTVMITISAAATAANAGTDQNVCGTTTTLAAIAATVGTGSWSQVTGPGGVTITTPSAYNSTVTGLTEGVYTFRWTITNEACAGSSDDVQINVSVPPTTADAGADQFKCGSITTTTMAANTPTVGTGYWSLESGPNTPTITTPSSPSTGITGLITGTYVFRWNILSGPFCPPSSDDVNITITPNANAGSDQTLCNVTTTTLTGNINTSGVWAFVSGPNTPVITPGPIPNVAYVSGMITGPPVYIFKYTIPATAGCLETIDNVQVTNSGLPTTSVAGPDQNLCNVTGWTMAANTPSIGTGSWSKIVGTGTPTFTPGITSPTAVVSNATAQTYIYEWRITNGACISADRVTINISNIALTAEAGPEQTHVCGTVATMAATPPADPSYGIGNWSQISGPNTATISSLITYNTTMTGLIPGTYVFRWTITSGSCTPVYDDVTITVFANPTAANAGSDQNLCNATTATLAGNVISSGTGTWSQTSGPNTATIANPNLNNSGLSNLIAGVYVFKWTSTLTGCSTEDEVTITNYLSPTVSNAAPTVSNCLFSPLNLAGNTPTVGTGTWTQIAGNAVIISSPNSPTTTILGATAGSYTFRWTISNGTCTSSFSDEVVTVTQIPSTAIAGPNQLKTCNTTTGTLAGNNPAVGTGTWTQVSGPNTAVIANIHQYNTGLSGLIPGIYLFNWEIANGPCTSSDQVQFEIDPAYPDLGITKTDGRASYGAGLTTVYTIVVSNSGPDIATSALVTDGAPTGTTITGWTAVLAGGATGATSGSGNINQTVTIPVGGSITYTVTLAINCAFTGPLVNTATIAANICDIDLNPVNNTATDTDNENLWKTGNATTDWNTASNWSLGVVPSCTPPVNAIIPNGAIPYPIINTTGNTAANLIIQNGATLTINPGKDLTVCGCTEINGPCGLNLESDETNGNASFITSQTGTISYPNGGTACVDLWLRECVGYTGCWHYVSSPVTDAKASVFDGDYMKYFDEVTGSWSDYMTHSGTPLNVLQGYIVNNQTSGIRTFQGQLNDGTVQKTLTRHLASPKPGWNLVGNPYSSEIDLNTTLDWTNVDKIVYYYDMVAGNYLAYIGGPYGFGLGTRYVPSMQGFFVHVFDGGPPNYINTSGIIKFTDANRTTIGTVNFYKDEPDDQLWLKAEGTAGLNDQAIVYFRPDLTSGYDQDLDAIKLPGAEGAPQLYAVASDNTNLTIDGLAFEGINTVVPLEFYVTNGSGNYSITASKLESFRYGTNITLEDKKTRKTQELMANPTYTFSYSGGDGRDRFLLHFYNPFYGIDDQVKDQQDLQIYSSGHDVYVKDLTGNPEKGDLYLYNQMGQEISHKLVAGITLNKYTFDLLNGYYIVKVITKDKTYNAKVYLD